MPLRTPVLVAVAVAVAGLFLTAAPASAALVTYFIVTDPSLENLWPGPDGLIGTGDDVDDGSAMTVGGSGPNTVGSASYVAFDFGIPTAEPLLPSPYDAISFLQTGTVTVNTSAGATDSFIDSFDFQSGTEPFAGHGPYTATTSAPANGTYDAMTNAFSTTVMYDTTINGNPDSATMSMSGTVFVVDPNGAATGNAYLDNAVSPFLSGFVDEYLAVFADGTSGAATNFSFGDMPIQVVMIGLPVPEPSSALLVLGAGGLFLRRRTRHSPNRHISSTSPSKITSQ